MATPSSGLRRNYNCSALLPGGKFLLCGTDVGDMVVYGCVRGYHTSTKQGCFLISSILAGSQTLIVMRPHQAFSCVATITLLDATVIARKDQRFSRLRKHSSHRTSLPCLPFKVSSPYPSWGFFAVDEHGKGSMPRCSAPVFRSALAACSLSAPTTQPERFTAVEAMG